MNIKDKIFLVGVIDILADIFYEVLEKEDRCDYEARKKLEKIAGEELIKKATGNHFSGDIVREVYYSYQAKVREEIQKEINHTD